jgi:hypothetical protein
MTGVDPRRRLRGALVPALPRPGGGGRPRAHRRDHRPAVQHRRRVRRRRAALRPAHRPARHRLRLRAGLLTALGCLSLLVTWVGTTDGAFTPLGWFARVVPLLLLGVLIGRASDGLREAARVATRLAVAQARQRDAAEVNDTIVQHLSAAKWMFERGANDEGIGEVEGAITAGQSLVSELLTGLDDARQPGHHQRPSGPDP